MSTELAESENLNLKVPIMELQSVIEKRRASRALKGVEIFDEIVDELKKASSLAPSCFNNQPWHFIFVRQEEKLNRVISALSRGNAWAGNASMIVAVVSKKEDDCILGTREYFLFDTGMAAAFMILRAIELGLVAHPIAGYSPEKVKGILKIPEEMTLIALLVVGEHDEEYLNPSGSETLLSEKQLKAESDRPERKPFNENYHMDAYTEKRPEKQ